MGGGERTFVHLISARAKITQLLKGQDKHDKMPLAFPITCSAFCLWQIGRRRFRLAYWSLSRSLVIRPWVHTR